MGSLGRDLRYGLRTLRRTPLFTVVTLLCLGLGIGLNVTVFTFVNGIFLRPLPFAEPDRLVGIYENDLERGFTRSSVAWGNFAAWRERSGSFSTLAAYDDRSLNLTGSGDPARIPAAAVSHELFAVLGTAPARGRHFTPADDEPGAPGTVILSHGLWRNRFTLDPAVIGTTLTLDGEAHTVIGIMPEGFRFPETADCWIPLRLSHPPGIGNHNLEVVARLAQGRTMTSAQADLDDVMAALQAEYPATVGTRGAVVTSLRDELLYRPRTTVLLFSGVVCFVLLLVCANVANLMLTRSEVRQREIAIRTSLGANRRRIVQQFGIESLLLAGGGGLLGLLLAVLGRDLVLALAPGPIPYYYSFAIGIPVIAAAVGLSILSAILFGTAPAVRSSRFPLAAALREGGGLTGSLRRRQLRSALVVIEIALTLTILTGSGLMLRTLGELRSLEPGFETDRLLTLGVSLPDEMAEEPALLRSFFARVLTRIEALPGVEQASSVSNLPLGRGMSYGSFSIEGQEAPPEGQQFYASNRIVQPSYFSTMGVPLLSGRIFDGRDTPESAPAAIISRTFAERFWPGGDCLGARIKYGDADSRWPWMEIVGVVGDTRHWGYTSDPEPELYQVFAQLPVPFQTFVVRTAGDPGQQAEAVCGQIWAEAPDLPVFDILTMEEVVSSNYRDSTLISWLFGFFSAVAVMLALIGIYGVISCSVERQMREFGLRLALGAQNRDVIGLVLGRVGVLVAIGIVLGFGLAGTGSRLIRDLLFGVSALDPAVWLATVPLVAGIALLASWLPVRRATRVDPTVTLRCE